MQLRFALTHPGSEDPVSGPQVGGCDRLAAVGRQPDRPRHLQRGKRLGGAPCGRAASVVEIAAGQQEKGQRKRRVEPGMSPGADKGLGERDHGRQQDRQGDRHVHPEAAGR